jgi:hypothetical protein
MSEHSAPAVKPADDPAFKLPPSLATLHLPLCIGGLVALLGGWLLAKAVVGTKFAMSAYLTAFMYCLTVTLGCLFFVLIQHLCRVGWSAIVRRIAELVMMMVIPLAILFLPILATFMGEGTLYSWAAHDYQEVNHIPEAVWNEKSKWLNPGFFTIRAIIYFAIWGFLAYRYFRGSVQQDQTGERAVTDRMQFWSGPAVMAFCGATSFAAFDWVMALAPMWFSTMFGVYIFAGSVLSAHCAIAVGSYILQKNGAMRDEITVEHYHDLGKLMFGFTFFWTYIAFSQFMLIWYANIPEEQEWFFHRQEGVWGTIALGLIFFHWMLPFAGTMSRHVRRNPKLVFGWAIYILIMHFVDLYWVIMPESRVGHEAATTGGPVGVVASLLCVVGMVALMLGLIVKLAEQYGVVAVRDPRLAESIAFENI